MGMKLVLKTNFFCRRYGLNFVSRIAELPTTTLISKAMGMLINALAPDCSVKNAVAPAAAVHAKKDYNPAKSGFVAISKSDVEDRRRKAYAYAF